MKNLTILDFGSGTGLLTEKMSAKAKQIVAVDTSEKMIEVLRNKELNNVVTYVGELSGETINAHPFMKKYSLLSNLF